MADQQILGADLLLRLGIDASGVSTELSSKMTAVERQAVSQGAKISDAYGKANDKVVASQLRVVAAQERVNKLAASERATLAQRATATSSLITAQGRYNAELARTATHTTEIAKASSRRGGGLVTGLAAGAGLAGASSLLDQLRQSKDAAVQFQDVVSANQVTFGAASKQLRDFERQRADSLNLSKLDTEQLTQTFGQVFKGAGASNADAARQGLELTKRAADTRSFFGGSLSDAADAFRSALVGEQEPIRRYGVLLDEAKLKQRAFSLGLVDSTKGALSPAVKAQAAYAEILAQTSKAQGDVARTSGSAANKIEDAKQKADDARVVIGTGLLPLITELATAGSEAAPAIAAVGGALGKLLGNDAIRHGAELGVAAVGIVKLSEALAGFTSRTAEKIGGNVALARSYDVVAASAGRAALAEGAASGAGAGGGVLARNGIRGFARNPRLLGLGLAATAAGSAGLLGGPGSGIASVAGATVTGAELGSFVPGVGNIAGGLLGAGLGIGSLLFTSDKGPSSTNRTPAQVRRDLAQVAAQRIALQARAERTNVDDPAKMEQLRQRQAALTKELKLAQDQATKTTSVFDQATGTYKNLTQAQLAAAAAADTHSKSLEAERQRMQQLKDSFAVDPFGGAPDTKKALSPEVVRRRLDATVAAARQQRRDVATIAGRGATREDLDALRGLEATAPGTIHRLAHETGRGFVRELSRELGRLGKVQGANARLFDGVVTAAEKAGRRAARAQQQAYEDELAKAFQKGAPSFALPTPGNVPFVINNSAVARRRRQP